MKETDCGAKNVRVNNTQKSSAKIDGMRTTNKESTDK